MARGALRGPRPYDQGMEFDDSLDTGVTFDLFGPDATTRRVREAAAKRRTYERLTAQLAQAVEQVEAAEAEVMMRREALVKERRDVEEFHTFSFSKLMDELKGDVEDRLRQEIAEANAAHYAVSEAEHRRQTAVLAMARINDRLADLGDAQGEWVAALKEKEAELRAHGDPRVPRLAEIESRWGEIEDERAAIVHAIESAGEVTARLDQAAEIIETAPDWGILDTLFDGGVLVSSPRENRMDEAADMLRSADDASEALRRDLRGVMAIEAEDANLASLHHACQGWCGVDGLDGEGGLMGQLDNSLKDIQSGKDTIERVVKELERLDLALTAEWVSLRDERRAILSPPPQAV